jgi:hypothetical protein
MTRSSFSHRTRRLLKENGLSLVLLVFFLLTLGFGQTITGHHESNKARVMHGQPPESMTAYLTGSHFLEATMENWESEFLQMGLYVWFTAFLYQKGSSESKSLTEKEEVDREPDKSRSKDVPWPVRKGGWFLRIYKHSLSLAFLCLFLVSFLLHGVGGCGEANEELAQHGLPAQSLGEFMLSSRFWFESFQNWQSEFLAILSMVTLSIFLREHGSPESKPVDAPHSETGE